MPLTEALVQEPSANPGPAEPAESTPFSPYAFERQRVREFTMPTVANFSIPDSPPPPERNSEEAARLAATTKKFERFLELKKQDVHFNMRLQNSVSLRNPSLLPKLMDFAGIGLEQSYESTLPIEVSVPAIWPEDCYVENLVRRNERREKKRLAERGKVDFVSAATTTAVVGEESAGQPGQTNKKSKFDR